MRQVSAQTVSTGNRTLMVVLVGHSYIRHVRDFMYNIPHLANVVFFRCSPVPYVSLINSYLRSVIIQRPHVFRRHQCGLSQGGLYFDRVHLDNYGVYKYWRSLHTVVCRELRRYRPVHQWSDGDCHLTTIVKCCESFETHCTVVMFIRYNDSNFVLILPTTMQTSVALIALLNRTAYYSALVFICY